MHRSLRISVVWTLAALAGLAADLVAEARANGVAVAELQVDFDCAERKLDDYRCWVDLFAAAQLLRRCGMELMEDLAWEAAQLMPDNADETARVLCVAGSWLKNRDPEVADKFYKALVRRCRRTALGKAADLKRWFPTLDENGEPVLPRDQM